MSYDMYVLREYVRVKANSSLKLYYLKKGEKYFLVSNFYVMYICQKSSNSSRLHFLQSNMLPAPAFYKLTIFLHVLQTHIYLPKRVWFRSFSLTSPFSACSPLLSLCSFSVIRTESSWSADSSFCRSY